ncbi:hypothetical protein [Cytobacillus horneckiae]|uniref:hypothetical protein n=1 Tax=Cytobacillus horneckiae TaxID=549687 RepID=UPI003D9A0E1E
MSSSCTCHNDAESCDWCKIEGIKERANNATVGPWKWEEPDDNTWSTEMPMILNDSGELILNFGDSEQYYPTEGVPPDDKDAQFIIHAREDIPYLVEYIKKQQQEITSLSQINNILQKCNSQLTEALENLSSKKEAYPYPISINEMKRRWGFSSDK